MSRITFTATKSQKMKIAELPENETDRLNDLREYKIMDTPPEVGFDDLVRLAAQIAKVPMSLIALIDEKRQWFKSSIGVDFNETPREISFCSHTILGNSLLLVKDTAKDDRFRDNPFVNGAGGIRFYAGIPLMSYRGNPIGTLCVLDISPNDLNEDQRFALYVLSQQVVKHLELKRINENLERVNKTQNLLMSIILRDVKSPLAATGTFLNLLQKEVDTRFDMAKFAVVAARQFNRSLALLDNVVQWGKIRSYRNDSMGASINTNIFVECLFEDLNRISYSGGYSLINKASDLRREVRCANEFHFIIYSSILWLFDCADSGEIVIEEISEQAQGLAIRIMMNSKSSLKLTGQSINKLNSGCLWLDNSNLSPDGLPFRLAKDIVLARNGSIVASYSKEGIIEINILANF